MVETIPVRDADKEQIKHIVVLRGVVNSNTKEIQSSNRASLSPIGYIRICRAFLPYCFIVNGRSLPLRATQYLGILSYNNVTIHYLFLRNNVDT
jgi:hypothetical protein